MLFDITLSEDKLWLQSRKLHKTLFDYAQLSLIDDQQLKDDFVEKTRSAIVQLNWDSIHGACYHLDKEVVIFSLAPQGHLAAFLLAAGVTFFDGEFNHLGGELLNALIRFLYHQEKNSFFSEVVFHHSKVPCVISGDQLLENLGSIEKQLLLALTNHTHFEKNKNYWIKYQHSLPVAANQAAINYKQAQIVENSLKHQLKDLTANRLSDRTYDETITIENNAQMIRLIVQADLWNKMTGYRHDLNCLVKHFQRLLSGTQLSDTRHAGTTHTDKSHAMDSEALIYLCHSLLDYCQIHLDKKLVELIYTRVLTLSWDMISSERATYQFNEILIILASFANNTPILGQDAHRKIQSVLEGLKLKSPLVVHFFSANTIDDQHRRQELLSCYNPYLKIYSID